MQVLILRFDAPLMSFGAPIIDRHGVIRPFAALSMLTGLLGNALGWYHRDASNLERLQKRIRYACRADRSGTQMQDYQTVDLGQEHLEDSNAWTTRGNLHIREGGTAGSGTHIRLRDFVVDGVMTVALGLEPDEESPSTDHLEHALRSPARPLFIGRKPCLPSEPILVGRIPAQSPLQALLQAPLSQRADDSESFPAWWGIHTDEPESRQKPVIENVRFPVTDERDWVNQIHTGERWIATGEIWVQKQEQHHG